jgi:O-antigen/teichoic acid export membrane protein
VEPREPQVTAMSAPDTTATVASPPAPSATAAGATGARFLKLGLGEAAARVLAFVATVYLARTLGASVYGVIVAATTVVMYLTFIADCGMDMIGVREVSANPAGTPALLAAVLGSRLVIVAALLALTTTVGLFVMPAPDGPALALYAGTLVATALGTRWVHLGLDRAGNAAWARVLSETTTAVLVLALVRGPEHLLRVPVAQIVGETLASLMLLALLPTVARPRALTVRFDVTTALVKRSWAMVAHGILGLAIFNSDFLFLRILRDSAQVGYYAVAYTLISFFQNLGVAYTMSLIPSLTHVRTDRKASQQVVDDAMAQVLFGALPIMVGGVVVAPQLIALLFGANYAPSVTPLRILLLLVPVALVRNVVQAVLVARERQDLMLRTVTWAAATNVALNLLLIPRFGMSGAAVATLVTEGVRTVLSVRYARQLDTHMTAWSRFTRILIATGVLALAVWPLRNQPAFISIPVGGAAYLATLIAAGGIRLRGRRLPELPL